MATADPRLMTLFSTARNCASEDERSAYLDQACAGDAALRAEVEALLRADAEAGGFLESPRPNLESTIAQSGAEVPGTQIGPYKLVELIGEGGMGSVYLAQQTEPVKRLVALKVIKAGMDSKQVLARFEAERQALALMDHPNIAKVLDAGTTGERRDVSPPVVSPPMDHHRRANASTLAGRPYFVMELVKGVPITRFCDERKLTPRERLELFLPVCHAIQHAHQKGIIHRDIKPTNVLVALYDGKPVPKVIDFGVAKAAGQPLTEKTLVTGLGAIVGTPEYMSPEQAELNQLDIDTRSDIYSLGVLLYELLTGTTPLTRERLMETGLLEALRIVREEEVPTLSNRLSTTEELAEIASRRGVEASRLTKLLRGELEWIVMKALEKDRARRYEMASGLAADVQRYLADEAVQACPPTFAYRASKFIRRNRSLVAAGSAISFSLAVGFSLAISGFVTAKAKEREAVAEARKSRAVLALVQDMLGSANPLASKGPDYTVRQVLDDFATRLSAHPMEEPAVEADVRVTIGRAYRELGLGDEARSHLERALQLRKEIHGEAHALVAESLVDLAWNAFLRLDLEQTERLADEALSIHRRLGERNSALAEALRIRGLTLQFQGRWTEGEPVLREALAVAEESSSAAGRAQASMIQAGLARSLIDQNRLTEAETLAREALAVSRAVHADQHPETADRLWVLGDCLCMRAQSEWSRETTVAAFAEAERHYRTALGSLQRIHGGPHPSQLGILEGLVTVLCGQYRQSDPAVGQARSDAFEIARRTGVVRHRLISSLCWARLDETDLAGAEELSREAAGLVGKQEGPYHSPLLPRDHESRYTMMRAFHLQQVGRLAEARAEYAKVLPLLRRVGDDASAGAWPLIYYSWASMHGGGDDGEALQTARRAVAASASGPRQVHALALHCLARATSRTGNLTEAIECQQKALKVAPEHELFIRRFIESALVEYLEGGGDSQAAQRILREGVAARETALPAGHPEIETARVNLAAFLARRKDYTEAERLLSAAYGRLAANSACDRARLRHAASEAVKLHELRGDAKKSEEWRAVLSSLEAR